MARSAASIVFLGVALAGAEALAVPGPDSVAIVANSNQPGSVALAELYRAARHIPRRQLCALDLPSEDTISYADFESRFAAPLATCLAELGARIEALVLVRGVPLRVSMPLARGGEERVALAAAAAILGSTSGTGGSLFELEPGVPSDCGGTPCYVARFANPFRRGDTFDAGYTRTLNGVNWKLRIVHMLHGRSDADAAKLIASATTADALGPPLGEVTFMDGADPARGALDRQYNGAITALTALNVGASRTTFDANLTGRTFASFFTGTAGIGGTIEGNTFSPGAIVDNLTSFGALPPNFGAPAEEVQVSIARWVSKGVAGVHGTTDEPLNNCFPDRTLIVDYAEGGTMGEAFLRRMPFVYWRNLVLGDPITAPYASRPSVTVTGVAPGEATDGARMLRVVARAPSGRALEGLRLFVDGVEVATSTGAVIQGCFSFPAGDAVELLAVAQVAGDHRPKGWTGFELRSTGVRSDCATPVLDAGLEPDTGTELDAGALVPDAASSDATPVEEEGCGCDTSARSARSGLGWAVLLGVLSLGRSRARARRSGSSRTS